MPPVGDPQGMSASGRAAHISAVPRSYVRTARAANDNHSVHATWRRFVAAGMTVLFAASLILVGLVCIARAGEFAPLIIAN
jgi:hypothetical protein